MEAAQNSGQVRGRPFPPGVSGNPGGRPKLERPPSLALAELAKTAGDTPEQVVENFKAARRAAGGLLAVDHTAIAMFRAQADEQKRTHVSAFESATDRLEGKVTQPTSLSIDLRDAASKLAQELDVPVEEVLERVQRIASGEKS